MLFSFPIFINNKKIATPLNPLRSVANLYDVPTNLSAQPLGCLPKKERCKNLLNAFEGRPSEIMEKKCF